MNNRNPERYSDPTAYRAIINASDKDKVVNLGKKMFEMCEEAGFSIKGKLVLIDNKTGKVWGVKK